jgi:hypothetical protein
MEMTAFRRGAIHDRRAARRGDVLLPGVLAALLLGAACGGADDGDRGAASDQPVTVDVEDALADADVATLSQASDTVVRGRVISADGGLRLDDSSLRYTAFTVDVDEALAGTPADRVRVVLSTHTDGQEIAIEGRPTPQVGDEGVWFLTPIAAEFDHDGYVLTGQTGLLLLEGGEVTGGGTPGESPIAVEVERLDSPEAVVDHVRAVAG